jgi:hypothetical protein
LDGGPSGPFTSGTTRGAPVTFVRYEQAFDRYIAEKAYKDIGAAAVQLLREGKMRAEPVDHILFRTPAG